MFQKVECHMKNKILTYNPKLKSTCTRIAQAGNFSEVLLWQKIRGKSLLVEFHRQVPIDEYIVDFYCHELMLAIEVDGYSHTLEGEDEKGLKRQEELEKLGVNFIRFNDNDVKDNIEFVVEELRIGIKELQQNASSFK